MLKEFAVTTKYGVRERVALIIKTNGDTHRKESRDVLQQAQC